VLIIGYLGDNQS